MAFSLLYNQFVTLSRSFFGTDGRERSSECCSMSSSEKSALITITVCNDAKRMPRCLNNGGWSIACAQKFSSRRKPEQVYQTTNTYCTPLVSYEFPKSGLTYLGHPGGNYHYAYPHYPYDQRVDQFCL